MDWNGALHGLAEVEAEAVVSLQVNLDPSTTPTPADISTRVHALLDEIRRRQPESLSHDGVQQFHRRVERVEQRLADPTDMGLPAGRRMGAVVFAWDEDRLEVFPIHQHIDDRVAVGRRPALADVAARAARADDLLLLVGSREEGRLIRFRDGHAEDVFNDHTEAEARHHQGGWAQMTLQHWVDNAASGHLREVVEHLQRRHAALGRPPILVSADDSARALIEHDLSKELQAAVVGWVGNEHGWGVDRLIEQVDATLAELDRKTEDGLLDRWRDQQGESQEHPEDRLQYVLDQVSDGRVEWLLLPTAPDFPVLSCPDCRRLYAHPGECPLDGSWLETDDGADAIACETLRRAGHVWELLDTDNTAIGQDGLAAILRY